MTDELVRRFNPAAPYRIVPLAGKPVVHSLVMTPQIARDQASRLDLLERCGQLLVRVDLAPSQHLNDPVIREQVEAEAFRFTPSFRPADALGLGPLAPGQPAFEGMLAIATISGRCPLSR